MTSNNNSLPTAPKKALLILSAEGPPKGSWNASEWESALSYGGRSASRIPVWANHGTGELCGPPKEWSTKDRLGVVMGWEIELSDPRALGEVCAIVNSHGKEESIDSATTIGHWLMTMNQMNSMSSVERELFYQMSDQKLPMVMGQLGSVDSDFERRFPILQIHIGAYEGFGPKELASEVSRLVVGFAALSRWECKIERLPTMLSFGPPMRLNLLSAVSGAWEASFEHRVLERALQKAEQNSDALEAEPVLAERVIKVQKRL